ncbi:MAG: hypothetical protein H6R18_996 [Proteobacteria bacterium]|nr:hypothetical protein [Pseudomonadota bacterium]
MSLINDMLRDLETRRSDEIKRQNLQGEIRPLPAVPQRSLVVPLLTTVVLIVLLAAVAYWWFMPSPARPTMAAVVVTTTTMMTTAATTTTTLAETAPATTSTIRLVTTTTLPVTTTTTLPMQVKPVSPAPSEKLAKAVPVTPSTREEKPKVIEPLPSAVVVEKPVKPSAVGKTKGEPAANIEVKTAAHTPRERAEADYRSAQTMLSGGRSAEAVDALRSALKHDLEYTPARQLLIRELLEQRRIDETMAVLSEGLEHQPRQTAWAMSLARLQVEKNDLAAAERTLARFAVHAAGNAEYAGFHAHVHYRLGHFREAVVLYQNAARLATGEGRWWFGLGVALEGDGRNPEARDAFRQALATGTLNAELSALAMQRIR